MNTLRQAFHHFFIPQESNNYRAKALHLNFLTYYLIAAIALSFIYKPLTTAGKQVLGVATDITTSKLFDLTNQQRQQNGLAPLTYNDKLAAAAQAKAANMFEHNYWAHYGPDGASPWAFILGAGYKYQFAGENLAKDFLNSSDVVNAWMASPTHRANIVKPEYQDVGYAVMNGNLGGEETTLVVQMFGKAQPVGVAEKTQPPPAVPSVVPTIPVEATIAPSVPVGEPQILSAKNNVTVIPSFLVQGLAVKMSIIFFSILLIALFFDLYYAHKLQVVRVTGKNLAHVIFISFIIVAITFIAKGKIL